MNRTWTSALHEALAEADRLDLHNVVDIPADQIFAEERDPAYDGVGPDGVFEAAPVLRLVGAEKIADLIPLLRIDDAKSGNHCMCSGCPWLRVYRCGEEIASFTWHHGRGLRWHGGPWSGDGALTPESAATLAAWFRAEGYPDLAWERESDLAENGRE
jgi:hypothetical protein